MQSFRARIFKIGINPYVFVPAPILKVIFKEASKDKGPIPIKIIINEISFIQTLVKYSGKWRLYLNGPMRETAGKDVGDMIDISIVYDPVDRTVPIHPKLKKALSAHKKASTVFESLPPSRRKEIARYINSLKTEEKIDENVKKAINFLLGKDRFVGRDKP